MKLLKKIFNFTLYFFVIFNLCINSFIAANEKVIITKVPLISIINDPEKYNKKIIILSGYVSLDYEDYRLYFCKDYSDHLISSGGSIWYDYDNIYNSNQIAKLFEQYHHKYVELTGKFDSKSSSLILISKIVLLKRR